MFSIRAETVVWQGTRQSWKNRRLFMATVAILCLSACSSIESKPDIPLGPVAEDAFFRGDLQRTGVSRAEGGLVGELLWRSEIGGKRGFSSPVVFGDTVFVGSGDRRLYAVDAASGEERWRFETGGRVESSPSVDSGTVYVGSDDGYLYALDAESGAERWSFGTGGKVRSSPAIVAGVVYFGSSDGGVYALDAGSGQQRWRFRTEAAPQRTRWQKWMRTREWSYNGDRDFEGVVSSLAYQDGVLFFGSTDGNLYAVDADDGRELWRFVTNQPVVGSPTVVDDTVYFANLDGQVYAADLETGKRKWRFNARTFTASSPAVADGVLYIGSFTGVFAVDTETGQELWRYTKSRSDSSPLIAGLALYIGSDDTNLYAVDIQKFSALGPYSGTALKQGYAILNGEDLWTYAAGAEVRSTPTASDGTVYFTTFDGYLYAVR